MSSFAEYTKNRKKKKEEQSIVAATFGEFTKSKLGIDFLEDDEIAPVTTTKQGGGGRRKESTKATEEERTWFKKGGTTDGFSLENFKSALATHKDLKDNAYAGIIGMGETAVDTVAYILGGAGGLVGADGFQNKMQDFIAKDLYDEQKVAEKISPFAPSGNLPFDIAANILYKDTEEAEKDSIAGEKLDSLAQSGGQLGATALLQAVGVPWFLTTGATSFGGEVETAFKEDATYGEAGLSGLITAGADILTEKISGGIKFGGKTLDAGLTRLLADKISNKAFRTATKLGMDVLGEGSEEVLAGMISNLGTSLYKEENLEELLFSEEAVDEYIESFIGGAVLGGGVSGANAINSKAQGRDYTTGLTDNEQKVIDKEVENRIAEREADGTKLDKKAKAEIKEQVEQELERGGIGIDTIESALGGETYDSYKSITEQEETLKREIEQLKKDPRASMQKRLQEAEAELREIEESGTKTQLKEQLSREVSELAKSDRVVESYNEQARKSQSFEADLSKYEGKQKENVQRAIDSGILNNTRRTHEFVDLVSRLSAEKGVLFDFTNNENLKKSGFAMNGKTVNGLVTSDGNVVLNIDSKKALNTVVGHEITHVLEGTDLYTDLQNTIIEYAKSKGEYDSRYENIVHLYRQRFQGKDTKSRSELYKAELTADLVGDYLFTDSDFINNLSATKPNLFKKIYDEIKYLVKVATAGSKEARELEKVKKAFDKAFKETGNVKTDTTRHMLSETYAKEVDEWYNDKEAFEKVGGFFRVGTTSDALKSIDVKEQEIFFDQSKIKKILNDHPEITIEVIKKVPQALENPIIVMQSKTKTNSITIYGEVYAEIDGKQQPVMVSMILTPSGKSGRILDVQKISNAYVRGADAPASITDKAQSLIDSSDILYVEPNKKRTNDWLSAFGLHLPVGITNYGPIGKVTYYDDAVKDAKEKVGKNTMADALKKAMEGTQFSLSEDSNGRKLSEKQQEYFKDSKVVDENGHLKVMYHGTANDFTVFNPMLQGGKNGIAEGYGIYFADTNEVSDAYGGKLMTGYLNVTHPATSDKKTIKRSELVKLIKATTEAEAKKFVDDGDYDNVADALKDTWVSNYVYTYDMPMSKAYNDVAESIIAMSDSDMSIVQEVMSGMAIRSYESAYEFYDILKSTMGIDGFVTEWVNDNISSGKAQIVVAFDSNQFKNIDNTTPTDNPDINLSLSKDNQKVASKGNYNVYGKDIALDIAPVRETVAATPTQEVADDYAPLTEEQANERDALQGDRAYSLTENDMPDEVEAPIYDEALQNVAPESPFDEKDIQDVGNRKVKAYMYENPEVKPYFQEEAQNMLYELQNSVKGEKSFNDQLYYDTNGEQGWFGTKRETSEHIAYMLDRFKYTYADIEKGLKAIIEDHGAENNAISKRLEFMIDERLREGYSDFMSGYEVPANQDYINLLTEKQINSYSDEAYNQWLETLAQEYAAQDIAPSDHFRDLTKMIDDIAPTSDFEAVAPMDYDTMAGKIAEEQRGIEDTHPLEEIQETVKADALTKRAELHRNIVNNIKSVFSGKGFDFDEVLKNAKDKSTFASVDNTPQRFMEKALGYKEGQILSDLTVNQVAQNETKGIKWLNSFTDRKNGFLAQISKEYGIKPRSKESAAAQMYGEGFYVDGNNELVEYGDKELAMDFPDAKVRENIKRLANDPRIRRVYDDTLAQINESRKRNGYPEIPKRNNYYLHFRAMEDTFSRLGLPFNPNDIRAKDLPTDINGMTVDLKPGQPYFASAMQRKGNKTTYDLMGGLERYLTSAKNQIYHIDDIQTLRALRNYIADTYGQAKGLESLDTLTDEEAEARIEQVYNAHLSTFAKFLNEEANVLAGKTALIDRGLEGVIGRRGITFLDTLNRQVGSNMVGFNVSSSLTNFVSVAQAFAKSSKYDSLKAFAQMTSNRISSIFGKSDGFAESNPAIIRRKGIEKFTRTPFEKMSDAGYILMSAVDSVSTEFIARAKFNELTRKGMNEQQAHIESDKWVSRILGDRSLGQQPQLYNSKMLGLITKFQLEVRNQLDSQFYDTIQEAKVSTEEIENRLLRNAKKSAKITSTFVQLAVLQHLFGKAFESVAGYNPTFDIIGVIMQMFGFDDDEESEDTPLDNLEQGFLALLGDLPYTSTFTGGRIPISSALPIEQLVTGKDDYGNDKSRLETIVEAAPYYILPGGYGQMKKTTQGLGMFDENLPVSGSYTDSGNLRFPVEDTLQNRVQAGVFGQWATENARDYFDNERKPLKEKQIEEYAELDIPIKEYWKYREGLAEQETLEDKFDYIAGLDFPIEKKNIMINNVVDRKEPVDLTNYDDFGSLEEFDFAAKNPEKYEFFQENNIAFQDYNASEESKLAYTWAYKNPEKYVMAKSVWGDLLTYRQYVGELNDIKADTDSEGKTISGSRKEKVVNYINGLDADYGKKIILFKNEYQSDDTYNYEIIEYLNGRDDISYSDMETILKELGFTVEADGTVRW